MIDILGIPDAYRDYQLLIALRAVATKESQQLYAAVSRGQHSLMAESDRLIGNYRYLIKSVSERIARRGKREGGHTW